LTIHGFPRGAAGVCIIMQFDNDESDDYVIYIYLLPIETEYFFWLYGFCDIDR